MLVRRIKKSTLSISEQEQAAHKRSNSGVIQEDKKEIHMWGLFAMEDIPAGAFLMEYKGEIVTKKHGDMRGTYYDENGLSYLFDMNDPLPADEREIAI